MPSPAQPKPPSTITTDPATARVDRLVYASTLGLVPHYPAGAPTPRPTAQQLLGAIAASTATLGGDDLLLLYLAADAAPARPPPLVPSGSVGSSEAAGPSTPQQQLQQQPMLLISLVQASAPAAHAGASPSGTAAQWSGGPSAAASAHQHGSGGHARVPQDGLLRPEELLSATRRQVRAGAGRGGAGRCGAAARQKERRPHRGRHRLR